MKPTRLAIALLLATSTQSIAAPNFIPVGSNLGYGDASSLNTIFATTANPANLSANLAKENNYGAALSTSIFLEQNNANELMDKFDQDINPLLDKLNDNTLSDAEKTNTGLELKDQLNELAIYTAENFYITGSGGVNLPLSMAINGFGGLNFEISGLAQFRGRLLVNSETPISLDTAQITADTTGDKMVDIMNIDAAMYLKTAIYTEAAMAYANTYYQNQYGSLNIGVRGKLIQAQLAKSINGIDKYVKNSDNAGDQLQDDLDAHTDFDTMQNQLGLDLGLLWVNPNWTVGASFMNLNSPTFKYNTIGLITDPTDMDTWTELYYSAQVNMGEEVVLTPQTRLEGLIHTENKQLSLGGSIDLNESVDLMNQPYQWATASVAFATNAADAWWYALIPDVRLGYRQNLVGNERHFMTTGLTWGPLNLDFGFENPSDISDAVSGDKIPEAFMFNAGLEVFF